MNCREYLKNISASLHNRKGIKKYSPTVSNNINNKCYLRATQHALFSASLLWLGALDRTTLSNPLVPFNHYFCN
jgi:hypothetical protein